MEYRNIGNNPLPAIHHSNIPLFQGAHYGHDENDEAGR